MAGRLDEILERLNTSVAAMHDAARQSTALAAEHMAQMRNDVLWSGSAVLDANGQYEVRARAPFAAVVVHNTGAQPIVVTAAPRSQQPQAGVGVWTIPAGQSVTCPLLADVATLYGTPGGTLNVALLARIPAAVGRTA